MSNHVLITGASRGIGAATARLFAREGWDVALNYNKSQMEAEALAAELSGLGGKAVPIQADVSVPEEAARLVREAEGRGVTAVSLEATDMGRPLYEAYGFVAMENEMELPESYFRRDAARETGEE